MYTIFEKNSSKKVCVGMVFMRGDDLVMLYKMFGIIDTIVIPEVEETYSCVVDMTMLWH